MDFNKPISREEAVHNIVAAIILSIVTCGIYSLVWQYKLFATINAWRGTQEHSFWMYFLLSIITCGIYAIYYQWKFAESFNAVQKQYNLPYSENLPLIALLLTLFGLSIVVIAIEQAEINKWYEADQPALNS